MKKIQKTKMKNNNIETRSYDLRVDNIEDNSRSIHGLAIPVESRSKLVLAEQRLCYETIAREAITEELIRSNDIRLIYNHKDDEMCLARSKYGEGSLKLSVSERGLEFETELPNTELGNTILEGLRRGDIDEVSFGFMTRKGQDTTMTRNEDGSYERRVNNIYRLFEISVLDRKAAYNTEVVKRSIDEIEEAERALEEEQKKEILDNIQKQREQLEELCK